MCHDPTQNLAVLPGSVGHPHRNHLHYVLQKTVMCDCACPHGTEKRRVMAFVGGLDITKGRYDTPEHPLYPPDNRFDDDFRQVRLLKSCHSAWCNQTPHMQLTAIITAAPR
jgi:hypothetical protein